MGGSEKGGSSKDTGDRTGQAERKVLEPKSKQRMRRLAPLLTAEAKEALTEFPLDQVVASSGVSWPPRRAGVLDLFSGECGVAQRLAARSCTWSLTFDLPRTPNEDLDDPVFRRKLLNLIRLGCFIGVGGGPRCAVVILCPCDHQSAAPQSRMERVASAAICRRR